MTPQTQDVFTRTMAAAFDEKQIISVPTAFQSFFGRPENGAQTIFSPNSNVVDIDIIRGNEKIAALIPRGTVSRHLGSGQKDLRSEKFTAFSRKFPLSEEEGNITGDMILNRVAGENPYARQTRHDRMRYHALKIHHESIRKTGRMFEVLAAQSILTGKQDAIIGTANTDLQYDFRRNPAHIVTAGVSWAGGAADILGDIDAGCAKVRANGRSMPDMAVMGSTAIKSFIADTTVQELADNRRFELIEVSTNNPVPSKFARFVDGGFIARGLLRTPAGFELWLFTYLDIYNDDAGNPIKYLADDLCLIASSGARCDRYFGPPEMLPMVPQREQLYRELFGFDPMAAPMPPMIKGDGSAIDPAMFYCDAYVSDDWKKVTIRSQSAPIFATTQTDVFVTIDTEP